MKSSNNSAASNSVQKPTSMKVKQFLTRSIGPKALKVWMVVIVTAIIIASVGTYAILSNHGMEPVSAGTISSVLGGNWKMVNESSGNGTNYPGKSFPTLSSYVAANYTGSNGALQLVVLQFMSTSYADSEFSFISGFSGANSTGTLDGGPYAYTNVLGTTGFFPTPASSSMIQQHNAYIIFFLSSGFNFNLQQAKSIASDQVSRL